MRVVHVANNSVSLMYFVFSAFQANLENISVSKLKLESRIFPVEAIAWMIHILTVPPMEICSAYLLYSTYQLLPSSFLFGSNELAMKLEDHCQMAPPVDGMDHDVKGSFFGLPPAVFAVDETFRTEVANSRR